MLPSLGRISDTWVLRDTVDIGNELRDVHRILPHVWRPYRELPFRVSRSY
ncbi:hypothetical protein [Arthrobacter sp. B1I2]|nr:hypothetical protein [Arthrobacter sp. B1I2]MDQ0732188.1 hypothetical protein [Arthrobacter sp. B1I2]